MNDASGTWLWANPSDNPRRKVIGPHGLESALRDIAQQDLAVVAVTHCETDGYLIFVRESP